MPVKKLVRKSNPHFVIKPLVRRNLRASHSLMGYESEGQCLRVSNPHTPTKMAMSTC